MHDDARPADGVRFSLVKFRNQEDIAIVILSERNQERAHKIGSGVPLGEKLC